MVRGLRREASPAVDTPAPGRWPASVWVSGQACQDD